MTRSARRRLAAAKARTKEKKLMCAYRRAVVSDFLKMQLMTATPGAIIAITDEDLRRLNDSMNSFSMKNIVRN